MYSVVLVFVCVVRRAVLRVKYMARVVFFDVCGWPVVLTIDHKFELVTASVELGFKLF